MYIKFNQTGEALGETFKLNEIRYETQGERLIAAGVATAVTDAEFAEQQWAVNNPEASMAAGGAGDPSALFPTDTEVTNAQKLAIWGDSLAAGIEYPLSLYSEWVVYRGGGVSGETSTQIRTRVLAATDKFTNNTIIWAGRNNFSQGSTVLADIAAIVAALGHDRYIVISVLNGLGEGSPTTAYTQITGINASLASTYGDHYFDLRTVLVTTGLAALGITPTGQDNIDVAADTVPASLRIDTIHLTSNAYNYATAMVYAKFAAIRSFSDEFLRINDVPAILKALLGVISNPLKNSENAAGGMLLAPTITAQLNGDQLVGLIINPVFNANGKSSTKSIWIRLVGAGACLNFTNNVNITLTGNNTAIIYADTGETSIQTNSASARLGLRIFNVDMLRLFPTTGNVHVQNGGTFTDIPSARFAVNATTQGGLFPRMTTAQKTAISSPVEGLIVYDTDLHKLCVRGVSAWETVTSV